MVTFSMTFTDLNPVEGHSIFEVECLKNGASYRDKVTVAH